MSGQLSRAAFLRYDGLLPGYFVFPLLTQKAAPTCRVSSPKPPAVWIYTRTFSEQSIFNLSIIIAWAEGCGPLQLTRNGVRLWDLVLLRGELA
jgi:hypothetical protein